MTFEQLLDYALQTNCSDIHITVGTHLAVRRFGTLQIIDPEPSMDEARALIGELLTKEQLEAANNGKDLDFARFCKDGAIRIRVNVYHQRNNLAAAVRILNDHIPEFHELNLPSVIEGFCKLPRGLVLITGPTGSGKTTTLAAMVDYINRNRPCHIMTIEDPIEYIYNHKLAMIHQREVGRDVKDYATALRSSLREDPDIILIGEMRDTETADIGIRAAITGHLVLSTLHTNDAASTVVRLVDMGVAPYMVATSLIGVIAQRLVKVLCPECKKPRMSTDEENELMGIPSSIQIFEPCGCPSCNNTGYRGRTAIHEIIHCSANVRTIIAANGSKEEIEAAAKANGTKLLRDNVSELVQAGQTSITELIRTTYTV